MRVFSIFILFLISLYKSRAQTTTETTCTINRRRVQPVSGLGVCYLRMPNGVGRTGCMDNSDKKLLFDVTISAADFPAIGDSVICNNVDTGFDQQDAFFAQPGLFKLNGGTLDDILQQWGVSGFTGHDYDPITGDNDVLTSDPANDDFLGGTDNSGILHRATLRYVENSEGKVRFQFTNVAIDNGGADFQFKFMIVSMSFSNNCDTVHNSYLWPIDPSNTYSIYYNDPDVDLDNLEPDFFAYQNFVQEVLYFYSGTSASGTGQDETATAKHLAGVPISENVDNEAFYHTFKTVVKCGTDVLLNNLEVIPFGQTDPVVIDAYTLDICPECDLLNDYNCAEGYNVNTRGHLTWGWSVPEIVCTDNIITTLIKFDELSFENQHQQKYKLHVHSVYPSVSQTVNHNEVVDLVVRFEKNTQYQGSIGEIPLSCREIFIEYAHQGSTLNKQLRDSDLTFTDVNGNTVFDTDCVTSVQPLGSLDPDIITHTYPIHVGILNDIANVYSAANDWTFYAYDLNVKVYGTIPKFETNRKLPCGETNKLLNLWECPDNSDGVTENTCGGYLVSTPNTNAYNTDAYLVSFF